MSTDFSLISFSLQIQTYNKVSINIGLKYFLCEEQKELN